MTTQGSDRERRDFNRRVRFWIRNGFTVQEAFSLASHAFPVGRGRGSQEQQRVVRNLVRRRRNLLRYYRRNGLSNREIFRIFFHARDVFTVENEIDQLSPPGAAPLEMSQHNPSAGLFAKLPDTPEELEDTLQYFDEADVEDFEQEEVESAFRIWNETQNIIPEG